MHWYCTFSWLCLLGYLPISTCAVQVSPARARYQHPGDDGINAHNPAYGTRIEQKWMVCPLFFHRCYCNVLGSQNAHPLTETYISRTLFVFYLFITNHITDVLSDLSWTAVLACAEPCVVNRSVRFFSANRATPSVLVTKTVFIVHCVYWVCVCVFCTLSSVQSVNMYCLYVNCFCFCTVWSTLSRISLTKALVLWWCDNKSDLIWFHQKHLNLCSEDEWRSYGFGTSWGWVINYIIFILGWTNPLTNTM